MNLNRLIVFSLLIVSYALDASEKAKDPEQPSTSLVQLNVELDKATLHARLLLAKFKRPDLPFDLQADLTKYKKRVEQLSSAVYECNELDDTARKEVLDNIKIIEYEIDAFQNE